MQSKQYNFSRRLMTGSSASPRAVIMELVDSRPPANPHSYTEQDAYGVGYFCCPAWAGCLTVPLPCSCPPAHQLNVGNWKKSFIS